MMSVSMSAKQDNCIVALNGCMTCTHQPMAHCYQKLIQCRSQRCSTDHFTQLFDSPQQTLLKVTRSKQLPQITKLIIRLIIRLFCLKSDLMSLVQSCIEFHINVLLLYSYKSPTAKKNLCINNNNIKYCRSFIIFLLLSFYKSSKPLKEIVHPKIF